MTAIEPKHKIYKWCVRIFGCLGIVASIGGALTFGLIQLRQQMRQSFERSQQECLQNSFDAVKRGDSSALVMDSKLLPMLASDAECKKTVTRLHFASTEIAVSDVPSVAELRNVSSMTFYCTRGTKDLLLAARTLPITDLYFEMPDLSTESYLVLKDFPQLKMVRFEHVMDDNWIERLKSELPNVMVDAPFPRSKEP